MKSSVSQRIGLFGGTFDPVHNSHMAFALAALDQLKLTEVWFLPEKSPRYKVPVASYIHRTKMLELASAENNKLKVIKLPQENHDLKTLQTLMRKYPKTRFTMIVGIDLVQHLDEWDNYLKFLLVVDFLIVYRPTTDKAVLNRLIKRLGSNSQYFRYQILEFPPSDISSTKIRRTPGQNTAINQNVSKYIERHSLYI